MPDNPGGGTSAGTIAGGLLLFVFYLTIFFLVAVGALHLLGVQVDPLFRFAFRDQTGFGRSYSGGGIATRAPNGNPAVFYPSTNPCPPGTTDQTDWSATPERQPDGALRYPHVCK